MNDQFLQFNIDETSQYFSQQPDVVVAYLFGSAARGQATHLSDIDIAVFIDTGLGIEKQIDRQLSLLSDLERFAKDKVQVTLLNHVSPFLAYQVIRDGKLLYERNSHERVEFEVRAMKEYFDFQPRLQFYRRSVMDKIREMGLGYKKRRSTRTLDAARRIHQRLEGTTGD